MTIDPVRAPMPGTMASTRGAGVGSPCTDVCRLDPSSGLCTGCLRTLDEIAAWGALDDAARGRIWRALAQRRLDAVAQRIEGS